MVETWMKRGIPVRMLDGILCTGETYHAVVKRTVAKGVPLPPPKASLTGNARRATDLR